MSDDLINLTCAPREIGELTGKKPPTYRSLYNRVVDGQLPAERHNGRWYLSRADLANIAKTISAHNVLTRKSEWEQGRFPE